LSAASAASRPTVVPFAAVSFAYFAYAGLIGTYGPLWFQSLGYSTFAIGALTSLQSGTRLFSPYAWGWLADHTGQRERLLRLAAGGALVASAGYFVPLSYAWIAGVTIILFVCTAGVIPISEAALAHRVSSGGNLDVARYGRVRVWGSVGFVGAATACGFILQSLGTGRFPPLVFALLALLVGACWRLPASAEPAHPHPAAGGALSVLRQPVVAWFFAGVFLTVLAHTSLYAFYSLYLASLGYAKGEIGLFWAVGLVAEMIWFYSQGRWVHRLSLHGWLVAAAVASALRFALIAAFGRDPRRRPMPARPELRRPALGVHRRHHAPLPGSPARSRPGALHRARLRCLGSPRRGGGRGDERTLRLCVRVLGGERRRLGRRVVLPAGAARRGCLPMRPPPFVAGACNSRPLICITSHRAGRSPGRVLHSRP
jgi:PPP family 3-phenylpropionic acid transporter